jgi:hypothetical protein
MSDRVTSGMRPMHASLTQAMEDLHARIAETVLRLEPEAFDWLPAVGMPTVRELVTRTAAEERHWIAHCVLSELIDDSCMPESDALSADHPLHQLGCAGQISQTVLATLGPDQWVETHRVGDVEMSVAGCVLKNLEALAHALGQIELLADLWAFREQNQSGL